MQSQIDEMQVKCRDLVKAGNYPVAMEQVQLIVDSQAQRGVKRETTSKYVAQMGKLFNKYAMALANQGQYQASESLLKQVLGLLTPFGDDDEDVEQITGLTYNNLSSVYKRGGRISDAQNCLV